MKSRKFAIGLRLVSFFALTAATACLLGCISPAQSEGRAVPRSDVAAAVSADCTDALTAMAIAHHAPGYPAPPGDLALIKKRCAVWSALVNEVPLDPMPEDLADWVTVSMVQDIKAAGIGFVSSGVAVDAGFDAAMSSARTILQSLTASHVADLVRQRDLIVRATADYDRDLTQYLIVRLSEPGTVTLDGLDPGLVPFVMALTQMNRFYPSAAPGNSSPVRQSFIGDVSSSLLESHVMAAAFADEISRRIAAGRAKQDSDACNLFSPVYDSSAIKGPTTFAAVRAEADERFRSFLTPGNDVRHVNLGALLAWVDTMTALPSGGAGFAAAPAANPGGLSITFANNADVWSMVAASSMSAPASDVLSSINRPWSAR